MQNKSRAFTLIELLVVVLIIGILAAVAVPQYRVAVLKARYVQAMAIVDAMWKAQQVYYLANHEYADELSKLDLQLPKGITNNTNDITYNEWVCVNSSDETGYCQKTDWTLMYLRSYKNNERQCRAYTKNKSGTVQEQVCKNLGGTFVSESTELGYRKYSF